MSEAQTQDQAISNVPAVFNVDDLKPMEMPGKVIFIDTDQIAMDEAFNVRRFHPEAKKVLELAKDIAQRGQLQPILVRKGLGPLSGKYVPVDGFTRVRSIVLVNDQKMTVEPVKVAALLVDMTDAEAFVSGAAANAQRFGMSPIDYANILRVMTEEYGMGRRDAGKVLGKVPSWVTDHMNLLKFRPKIQKMIHEGKLAISTAREMVEMEEEEQDKIIEQIEGGGGPSRDEARAGKKKKALKRVGKSHESTDNSKCMLTLKEVRQGMEHLAGLDVEEGKECRYSEKVQEVAQAVIKFLDGKFGVKALAGKIDS